MTMHTAITVLLVLADLGTLVWLLARYLFWLPGRDRRWPRILMLHRVAPEPGSGMNMPPPRFEALLRLLRDSGYHFVTMSELLANPEQPRLLALTFDDGFADNYQHAFPLLRRYGAKATIYLATEIEGIERLTPAQIQEMAASGLVEFGAHTLHHVNLTTLDAAAAEQEIRESRSQVEALAGSCATFAYPFGRFAPEHEAMVRAAGYSAAVSTRKTIEPLRADNRYRLPRISTSGDMDLLQVRIALAKGRFRL